MFLGCKKSIRIVSLIVPLIMVFSAVYQKHYKILSFKSKKSDCNFYYLMITISKIDQGEVSRYFRRATFLLTYLASNNWMCSFYITPIFTISRWIGFTYGPHTTRRNDNSATFSKASVLPHHVLPVCAMPHAPIIINCSLCKSCCEVSYPCLNIFSIETNKLESISGRCTLRLLAANSLFICIHILAAPTRAPWGTFSLMIVY